MGMKKPMRQANEEMQNIMRTFIEENERLRTHFCGQDYEEQYRALTARTDKDIEAVRQKYGIRDCAHCKP